MRRFCILMLALIVQVGYLSAAEPDPEEFLSLIVGISKTEIERFEKLADTGDPRAQLIIGLLKRRSRNSAMKTYQEPNQAIIWIKRSADQGYAPAQYFLVEICDNRFNEGVGGTSMCEGEKDYLDKAVASNYRAALWYKGNYYEKGKYGARAFEEIVDLYKKSGDLGYAYAFYSIGELFRDGTLVKADARIANEWYLKAANAGDATAQDAIGIRISEGIGTRSDNKQAVQWFQKSAEQGHVYGACNLALHYARGSGVRKNPLLALKWSLISNSLDGLKCHPGEFIELLRPSKTVIKGAQALAVEWLRLHPKLTNNFDERPWLNDGETPITLRIP